VLLGADLGDLNVLALLVECRSGNMMGLIEYLVPLGRVLVDVLFRF